MMFPLFADRRDAGRRLAGRLQSLTSRPNLIVLALPRGGVPVGYEVAQALGAPLDVFVVRKLGVPGHQELAMGAVASGGVRVVNQEVVRQLGVSRETFDAVTDSERRELERREREYRRGRPLPDLGGRTVVLVDDGVATGSTMLAAVHALRELGPAAVVVAAPVMSPDAQEALARVADGCESVVTPEPLIGVGMWYEDFTQTTDEEVRTLLGEATRGPSPGGAVRYAGGT